MIGLNALYYNNLNDIIYPVANIIIFIPNNYPPYVKVYDNYPL